MLAESMQIEPLVGLICDHTSPVLAGDIMRAGYRVVRVTPEHLEPESLQPVDAWVVDCENSNAIADATLWLEPRLVALSNRPDPADLKAYRGWCERIILTLDRWTADIRHADAARTLSDPGRFAAVDGVWVIAGSTGAFGAVKQFLRRFSHVPRIAFVYVQHIDPRQEGSLTLIGAANRDVSCSLALGRHWLNPGQLLIVPASSQLRFGRQGEIYSTRDPWPTPETPSIDSLLLSLSGIQPSGAIMLSGAGRDGCAGMTSLAELGTRIWVQDPETCEAPSMPRAVLQSRVASVIDSPEGLAARLLTMYPRPC
jgi:chemosensory pili system protein ChpB (putative protein-glutamate methylesterase)